jgi:cytoplasmic iron level regulating protein YaaA (DUF328/UPF0246 family)
MDTEGSFINTNVTVPELLDKTIHLSRVLSQYDKNQLSQLMKLSEKLASQTYDEYQKLQQNKCKGNKMALYSYTGEVYAGLRAHTFTLEDFEYSNNHLRILSGLFGVLRPSDGIQSYRLEMATRLQPSLEHKSLYSFWTDDVTKSLNHLLETTASAFLANLASDEYLKTVNIKDVSKPIIKFEFYEIKNGTRKFISFNAKRARGLMAAFIIKNQVKSLDALKCFDGEGYFFDSKASNELCFTFVKPERQ